MLEISFLTSQRIGRRTEKKIERYRSAVGVHTFALFSSPVSDAFSRMSNQEFRPPAVPLVTHTPYFSIWCAADKLTDAWSTHWTGHIQALCGILRIDGSACRFMGLEPSDLPVLQQRNVSVSATMTTYQFEGYGVVLDVEFLSPLIPEDLDLLTRPITYVTFTVHAIDSNEHKIEIYFDNTAELAVDRVSQKVIGTKHQLTNLDILSFQSVEQSVLGRKGDDIRIDWGVQYLAIPGAVQNQTCISSTNTIRGVFARDGEISNSQSIDFPRAAYDQSPCLSVVFTLDGVDTHAVSRHLMLAYDELYSVEYFQQRLKPYWKRHGLEIVELLTKADAEYESIRSRCHEFNRTIRKVLTDRGGKKYAHVAELAFRQCISAHAIVQDNDGSLLMLSKENSSNGCIGTVDVTYPGAPFFLYFNSDLLKAQIVPVLKYASSGRWPFPFAPHDLGTYPKANGQAYGGRELSQEYQMPIEECGNMLILVAAVCQAEKKIELAEQYWSTLLKWANYLLNFGFNPENQLCTDDFAGQLAHNANLSMKAIVALGSFGQLCQIRAEVRHAQVFQQAVQKMATEWMRFADDGDHYRLAFDRSGSWSQKYNLVWQHLFGLNLFPSSVARKEISFYLRKQNRYGLPLDHREDYAKADWIVWTACLAENEADFRALVDPLYDFLHLSPSRVPFTDLYDTKTARQVAFQARSVVGGVFLPLLKPF